MKVKREDWEALQSKVIELEKELRAVRQETLMKVKTGPVYLSTVVPMILDHLKVELRHGYGWLLTEADRNSFNNVEASDNG